MDAPWLDLLNSDWHDYRGSGRREDRLQDPQWLKGFLARWQLDRREVSRRETRQALRRLRSLLQRLVAALTAGRSPRDTDLAALNACLAAGPIVQRVERDGDAYRLRQVPAKRGRSAVLGQIAASFAEVLVAGDPSRIKICENADCKWVFYDRSRNRTRRWCAGDGCGNLLKVRRFRARRKKGAGRLAISRGKRRGSP
jgi:predicted RNA-binding Zn ribbon-like protein